MSRPRKELITEVPEGMKVRYDYSLLEAQISFGATLKEAARQAGDFLGTKISHETIADIIAMGWPSEQIPDGRKICAWVNGDKDEGTKPKSIEEARAVARAFRLPEEYFTRFYETAVSSPLYEQS